MNSGAEDSSWYAQLNSLIEKLENDNPCKTIVLNAETLEIIIISDNPLEVGEKIKTLDKNIVSLFAGGLYPKREICFHRMC